MPVDLEADGHGDRDDDDEDADGIPATGDRQGVDVVSGWTKLFSSLPTSSVWSEDYATRIVWTTMLAIADADGVVEGSVPGFARLANVTVDEMKVAIDKLSSPDPYSRTPDHEGRRIENIESGWRILNYCAYRERGQAQEGSKAPAMRRYRARKRAEAAGITVNSNALPSVTDDGNALPVAVTGDPEERGERREEVRTRTAAAPQRMPAADPDPEDHYAVITAIVAKDILPRRLPDHELMAATKARCVELGIDADDVVVRKAIDSALFRYYRALRREHELPPDPRGIYHDHVTTREPGVRKGAAVKLMQG